MFTALIVQARVFRAAHLLKPMGAHNTCVEHLCIPNTSHFPRVNVSLSLHLAELVLMNESLRRIRPTWNCMCLLLHECVTSRAYIAYTLTSLHRNSQCYLYDPECSGSNSAISLVTQRKLDKR